MLVIFLTDLLSLVNRFSPICLLFFTLKNSYFKLRLIRRRADASLTFRGLLTPQARRNSGACDVAGALPTGSRRYSQVGNLRYGKMRTAADLLTVSNPLLFAKRPD
jgi:hypothetical protein